MLLNCLKSKKIHKVKTQKLWEGETEELYFYENVQYNSKTCDSKKSRMDYLVVYE